MAVETSGGVFNIQKYSLQDGPGIRTTIFLKGCPLCCAWCHNPEGISARREIVVVESRCASCGECRKACRFGDEIGDGSGPLPAHPEPCTACGACVEACPTGARQMIGRSLTVAEVVAEALKDRVFYEESGGGVTISGGEPLAQPRFLLGLLEAFEREGLHVALDTTGYGCTDHLLAAARRAALVLYDLKAFDDRRHRELTGVSNQGILRNLEALDTAHANVWIRLPIVPGFTDDAAELDRIGEFVARRRCVTLVNLLPFHRTGLSKYARLGQGTAPGLDRVEPPSPDCLEAAAARFRRLGLETRVGG